MANMNELKQIRQNFSENRRFLGDGYYRLVVGEANEYELEIATAGFCGDFSYHPKIKFRIVDDSIKPYFLIDQNTNPMIILDASTPESLKRLEQELDQLFDKFIAKIEN
ncbi:MULTISPECIES: hypothetical protein [unclassified Enterococcus]|uniref:hypothetical protein n=1 Tax=unclassified Enterococcus TaxID=2608891 RepID=UPI001555CF63|nr:MULTISPECIES: hypothetical protein [unclassified Enterococcus]MBS7576871.1 hypothetical protein [Enterococcus sp. MMGLQ5-2]MBS7584278.1 hypothetical protein [Enterococcus sp. MMGLQ5-1]NPD12134.1 hypothetical protein [Enterococcus sp. MMGLQ5-1]NPD36706.1 hypothetical protein [Enterococcus sp. MMGLQ5-2]